MATTFNVELGEKPNPKGEHPVRIRVTVNGSKKRIPLGFSVEPKDWDKKRQRVKDGEHGHPNAETYNAVIRERLRLAEDAHFKHGGKSASEIQRIATYGTATVPTLFQALLDEYEAAAEPQTGFIFKTVADNVRTALGDIRMDEVAALDGLARYERWARNGGIQPKSGELISENTIHKHLRQIRTVFNRKQHRKKYPNPFDDFDMPRKVTTYKPKLNKGEVETLQRVTLPVRGQALALDTFIFAYECLGMRIGDALTIQPKQIDNGVLTYIMRKTGTRMTIVLTPKALNIVAKWKNPGKFVFPYLKDEFLKLDAKNASKPERRKAARQLNSQQTKINTALKIVAGKIDLQKNLSNHIARHSFASVSIANGMDIYSLRTVLGQKSVTVTQGYIDEECPLIDAAKFHASAPRQQYPQVTGAKLQPQPLRPALAP